MYLNLGVSIVTALQRGALKAFWPHLWFILHYLRRILRSRALCVCPGGELGGWPRARPSPVCGRDRSPRDGHVTVPQSGCSALPQDNGAFLQARACEW